MLHISLPCLVSLGDFPLLSLLQISHREHEEITFRIHQSLKVGVLQPAAVSVYEYYDREFKSLPHPPGVPMFSTHSSLFQKHLVWSFTTQRGQLDSCCDSAGMRNVHVLKVKRTTSQCCTSAAASSLPAVLPPAFVSNILTWRNSFQRTVACRRRKKYPMMSARPWYATLRRMLKPILVSKSKHVVSEYICRVMSKMSPTCSSSVYKVRVEGFYEDLSTDIYTMKILESIKEGGC